MRRLLWLSLFFLLIEYPAWLVAQVTNLEVYKGDLIVSGFFNYVGDLEAHHIASWDGETWSSLGTGVGEEFSSIYDLQVYHDKLYVAGGFKRAGDEKVYGIAEWDGSKWRALDRGLNGPGSALAVYDDKLVVGGSFTLAGSTRVRNIAAWNGKTWSTFLMGTDSTVFDMRVVGNKLFVAGLFSEAGVKEAAGIASWDGFTWESLNTWPGDKITRLAVFDGKLIAGGRSTGLEGVFSQCNVNSWDGSRWHAIAEKTDMWTTCFGVWDDKLIVGAEIGVTHEDKKTRILEWDGSSWTTTRTPGKETVLFDLIEYQGNLIAGGYFEEYAFPRAHCLALWSNQSWEPFGPEMSSERIEVDESDTSSSEEEEYLDTDTGCEYASEYAEGIYLETFESSTDSSNGLAKIVGDRTLNGNGNSYDHNPARESVPGVKGSVKTMTIYQGQLVVGGWLSGIDDVVTHSIAVWDGKVWHPLGRGLEGAYYASVDAMIVYKNMLVVGGDFETANGEVCDALAVWDGTSWYSLGPGLDDEVSVSVNALAVYDGRLIVGGSFTTAGLVEAHNVAAWNGRNWSALGSGTSGDVWSLEVYNNELIAGGVFEEAGGSKVNSMAAWDGNRWKSLSSGVGGTNYPLGVRDMVVHDGKLYVGGEFFQAGDQDADHVAVWDGAKWEPLDFGTSDGVLGLASYGGELVAGGGFAFAGRSKVNGVAAWDGNSWSPLGPEIKDLSSHAKIWCFVNYNGNLIVGGDFATGGDLKTSGLLVWNGTDWSPFDSCSTKSFDLERCGPASKPVTEAEPSSPGVVDQWTYDFNMPDVGGAVNAMIEYNGHFVVGGCFETDDAAPINNLALWNGTRWSSLDTGLRGGKDPAVYALTVYRGNLVVGGSFRYAGGTKAGSVAVWDASDWSALGEGIKGEIRTMIVLDSTLIVGGKFNSAGGIDASNIAAWDGSTWSALGQGVNDTVLAMAEHKGELIVAGCFSYAGGVSAYRVAAWKNGEWTPKDSGSVLEFYPAIRSLLSCGGSLYSAGDSREFLETPHDRIAVWDGSQWVCRDSLFSFGPLILSTLDGRLVAGAELFKLGDQRLSNLVIRDGSSWLPLESDFGKALENCPIVRRINAIANFKTRLVIGGGFDFICTE